MILALDPGNVYTGYCLIDDYRPVDFGKELNSDVEKLIHVFSREVTCIVIERVASYGMPVGEEVFETCEQIGRFSVLAEMENVLVSYVYRKDEKMAICYSPKANDSTIRQALVDRFAKGQPNHGKGTKKEPGFFYGFSKDVWSAFAVGVTYLDRKMA